MRELTLITADTIPQWFKDKTHEAQREYLENHPNSKISRTIKKAEKEGQSVIKKVTKKPEPEKTAKPAQEVLEQKGSPTDFKGPKTASQSISGQPKVERNIVSKLDKLYKAVKKAKEAGDNPPDFDLCKISIPGTNLFCNKNKGIPRKEMPQLKGKPVPNSWADINLPKDKNGEVDGEEAFKNMLKSKGVQIKDKMVDAASLKATQSQLVGAKIAGMFNALKQDPANPGITAPIFVSKDGYILDGHHRWAAMVGLDMASGLKQSVQMPVHVVDMDIEDLVNATNDFADKIGIATKAGKVKEQAFVNKELSNNSIPYKVVYGSKGIRQLPGYAFFNMSKNEIQSNLDGIKDLLANRHGFDTNKLFLLLVDDNDNIVWSDTGNYIGQQQPYNTYQKDYDADDLCDCGCLGNC